MVTRGTGSTETQIS